MESAVRETLLHLFYRCPLLLNRPKQFIRRTLLLRFYWIGLRSLYVDQELKRQHGSFLFVRRWGK